MTLSWIKRAWRGLCQAGPFAAFGPKKSGFSVTDGFVTINSDYPIYLHGLNKLQNPEVVDNAAREATIAQKNVRLASIARTRDAVKREIARLKRNKKKHSHMMAELARLTRLELELESGK